MTVRKVATALQQVAGPGVEVLKKTTAAGLRRVLPTAPDVDRVPEGQILQLPGRGETFVVDVPGPTPQSPTIVLLHALGCTAYLSWMATFGALSSRYRVVTFDQRWHGRGIRSSRFRFDDCADDVVAVMDALGVERAVIAGYSMGGAVAQKTWKRHPQRVAGLVLCSTARNYRGKQGERLFFPLMTAAMTPLAGYALAQVDRLAQTLPELPSIEVTDPAAWSRVEFRSTSAWSIPEALAELGRFDSAAWIGDVDVPTAVVVTTKDRVIPSRRQHRLASAINGAQVFAASGGHAAIVLGATNWVPTFIEAADNVIARIDPNGTAQSTGVTASG
jgi:pimeloyl-ACP methyl ester carboxylesterase